MRENKSVRDPGTSCVCYPKGARSGNKKKPSHGLRGTPLFAGGYREIEKSICETQCQPLLYTKLHPSKSLRWAQRPVGIKSNSDIKFKWEKWNEFTVRKGGRKPEVPDSSR